jgi:hypothetical protein
LKADFILNECQEIKDFIQNLYSQSKTMSLTLGIEENNSISSMLEIKSLMELIILNPRPVKKWFNEGINQSLTELLQISKNQQFVLNDNLKKIRINYDQSIININFDEMLERFKISYVQVLEIISEFNNSSNSLELNKDDLYSFANNQAEKIKAFNLLITNAFEVSKQLTDKIGIKSKQTLKGLISLGELLSAIIENPKPTVAWFDENKEFAIDKIISDIENTQKEIEQETNEVLSKYNKDILSVDNKDMLIRFNTDYTSFFKLFKGGYGADKKIIRGFSKEPNNKLEDSDVIALLNKISLIKEKEYWLKYNKSLATKMLGSLYVDKYTNWEMVSEI